MKKHFLRTTIAAGVLALLATGTYMTASARTPENLIADHVHIGGLDVSGMTADQAREAVTDYVARVNDATITLKGHEADQTKVLTGKDLEFSFDNEDVIDEALALGKSGNIVERYKLHKTLENEGITLDLETSMDTDVIEKAVSDAAKDFNTKAKNFSLKREDGSFTVTDGADGYEIDEDASAKKILDALDEDWDGSDISVELVGEVTKPRGSREELSKVKDVLGTFTTSYSSSGASRSKNISNGCRLIDGITLYPGEEFSTLDAITPFTAENGYELAGSYLNGEVVESFGGGICQVSTTLYNACLLSELDITRRENHSMIVTYVKPSQDAAISESGGKDFKFKNNTDAPVYIAGYTEGKSITFTLYGQDTRDPSRRVSFESETLETIPATGVKFVRDPAQPVGYVKTTQSEHTGYKARLWKTVTEDGKQVSREIINSSYYMPSGKIVTVGTGGADANVQAALDAAIGTGDLDTVRAAAAGRPAGPVVSADIRAQAERDAAAAGVTDRATIDAYAQALAEQQAQQAAAAAQAAAEAAAAQAAAEAAAQAAAAAAAEGGN